MTHTKLIYMDILVQQITKANEAYRNGRPLLMTDEEYDAAVELLGQKVPNHPLLKKIRAPSTNGAIVKMPYYLGSLDKAKTGEELIKWLKKSLPDSTYVISEKLDGISGLWNPRQSKLYLSADDTTGVDVSSWLKYISVSPTTCPSDISDTVWIRGELILPRSKIPSGRLGRSIVNGIFHHKVPNPSESAAVRFVGYEILGMDTRLTVTQQFALLEKWRLWLPWFTAMSDASSDALLTKMLDTRRLESEYEMDGLVIKIQCPLPSVSKGNPKDALAWKPPNGEAKLTKVVQVEWNASATGKLVPRVQIEPVHLGGSTITYVSGVNARRIVDWKIGPGATVIIRKGGDVIPVIDRVELAASVVFPSEGTWEWDGEPSTAVNIKQKTADSSTIAAQYMKMVTRLEWTKVGPAQMKKVVDAGYITVPLLRKASKAALIELLGSVNGAHLYNLVQSDGWAKATELDLFVASPLCPSGIGKTRLDALLATESDVTRWSSETMSAPKGWSIDALKDFQKVWIHYEAFRKDQWSFIPYPVVSAQPAVTSSVVAKGSVVFTGFRDASLESQLAVKGYKVVDAAKSDTKAVLIPDKEDPSTYTSTKVDKAKKIPGCVILRKVDWIKI
jgi:hypothetical protein